MSAIRCQSSARLALARMTRPNGRRRSTRNARRRRSNKAVRWAFPFLAGASTVAFLGGLSIALRWNHRLAQAGCIGAALNVTGLCCVPGAVAGLWGLFMLDVGRRAWALRKVTNRSDNMSDLTSRTRRTMSRSGRPTDDKPLPPLYAMTHGGIETVAADEITRDLGGEVKKTARGLVVFRVDELTTAVLSLRTTEDVFLLAWGSDSLTYKADDLDTIRTWTAQQAGLARTSSSCITRSARRRRAGRRTTSSARCRANTASAGPMPAGAFIAGLAGKIPHGWQYSNENAWLEIWLTIYSKTAVCGVRLSDRTMRHRTYKLEHIAASLRPNGRGGDGPARGHRAGHDRARPVLRRGHHPGRGDRRGREAEQGAAAFASSAATSTRTRSSSPRRTWRRSGRSTWPAGTRPRCRWKANRWTGSSRTRRSASNSRRSTRSARCTRRRRAEWDRVLRPGGRAVLLAMEQEGLRRVLLAQRWSPARADARAAARPAVRDERVEQVLILNDHLRPRLEGKAKARVEFSIADEINRRGPTRPCHSLHRLDPFGDLKLGAAGTNEIVRPSSLQSTGRVLRNTHSR